MNLNCIAFYSCRDYKAWCVTDDGGAEVGADPDPRLLSGLLPLMPNPSSGLPVLPVLQHLLSRPLEVGEMTPRLLSPLLLIQTQTPTPTPTPPPSRP